MRREVNGERAQTTFDFLTGVLVFMIVVWIAFAFAPALTAPVADIVTEHTGATQQLTDRAVNTVTLDVLQHEHASRTGVLDEACIAAVTGTTAHELTPEESANQCASIDTETIGDAGHATRARTVTETEHSHQVNTVNVHISITNTVTGDEHVTSSSAGNTEQTVDPSEARASTYTATRYMTGHDTGDQYRITVTTW